MLRADDPPSAVASVLKLLKSGKVPPARIGSVVEMVCTRGNESDLGFVFQQILDEQVYAPELRRKALVWLKDAALNRKTVPGDRAGSVAGSGLRGYRTPTASHRTRSGLEGENYVSRTGPVGPCL